MYILQNQSFLRIDHYFHRIFQYNFQSKFGWPHFNTLMKHKIISRWVRIWGPNYKQYKCRNSTKLFWSSNKNSRARRAWCCIFCAAFGCCALWRLVKICFFKVFYAKKLKRGRKSKKIDTISSNKLVFWNCSRTLVKCFNLVS